ncbi:MAG: hypothetical protein J2P25_22660 [Nocardiopsaceae bacterium]|nr:hypothetical protein [Nocardiopsaceae bacterium]
MLSAAGGPAREGFPVNDRFLAREVTACMSKADEERQARLERARAIGLFRYMLIREAADPALTSRQRGAMVRQIAAREHRGPAGSTRWSRPRASPSPGPRRR